jgi:uncharacterized protein (TIGR00725 family)
MARKWIIGAIGGNSDPVAAELARQFGALITPPNGILMTGGLPQDNHNVKDAALLGCNSVGGLMISVLPTSAIGIIDHGRSIVLQTGLSSLGRDPITGAGGDIVVVFKGNVGTSVELAYAAFKRREIIFCGDPPPAIAREELKLKLTKAREEYGSLLNTTEEQLIDALNRRLAGAASKTPKQACDEVTRIKAGREMLETPTNFLGLPRYAAIKECFEQMVQHLSAL